MRHGAATRLSGARVRHSFILVRTEDDVVRKVRRYPVKAKPQQKAKVMEKPGRMIAFLMVLLMVCHDVCVVVVDPSIDADNS